MRAAGIVTGRNDWSQRHFASHNCCSESTSSSEGEVMRSLSKRVVVVDKPEVLLKVTSHRQQRTRCLRCPGHSRFAMLRLDRKP
jgi:hypothetical protein